MDPQDGKNLFVVYDDDFDGFLNFDQIVKICYELNIPSSITEEVGIDDLIDFEQFMDIINSNLNSNNNASNELNINDAFIEYDPELSGNIHIGILINILRTCLDNEEINEIIRDISYDDDLVVNYAKILHN